MAPKIAPWGLKKQLRALIPCSVLLTLNLEFHFQIHIYTHTHTHPKRKITSGIPVLQQCFQLPSSWGSSLVCPCRLHGLCIICWPLLSSLLFSPLMLPLEVKPNSFILSMQSKSTIIIGFLGYDCHPWLQDSVFYPKWSFNVFSWTKTTSYLY